MFNKISEIVNSWAISFNPTDKQKKLAEDRYFICLQCPKKVKAFSKTKIEFEKCNVCGCPINKKIFSNTFNACPLEKWIDLENEYFGYGKKNKKSIL
jgi:transcription elongation factor Elf1